MRNVDAVTWAGSFPSMETIATRAECSVSTARRAVRALESLGLLVTERGGGRLSNRYRLARPDDGQDHTNDMPDGPEDHGAALEDTTGQPGQDDRRHPISTQKIFKRLTPDRSPAQAHAAPQTSTPTKSRIRVIPDDLRPLAEALTSRGLRASFSLLPDQVDVVHQALTRVGVTAMVTAAYRAFKATDPPRWWSAWLGIWEGLGEPASSNARRQAHGIAPDRFPVPVASPDVTAAGLMACRAAVDARRRVA
ncbi:helix-turn-helix domain-containing protein [Frankia tisae]|uniref:helix-turn-helix domain-containing protein n=1 Tax=Frankia tisae TaxID=2950104 RepID=UPI0021BF3633|nr:helix-turn-helix domain-containing protein [Frankia tisae]